MKLSIDSWHAKLYNYIYPYNDYPVNFCNYFWSIILAIFGAVLLFPLGYLLKRKISGNSGTLLSILLNICFSILIFVLGMSVIYLPLVEHDYTFLISTAVIASGITGGVLLSKFSNRKRNNTDEEKKPNIFVEYVKAFKGNYCPKITWKQ